MLMCDLKFQKIIPKYQDHAQNRKNTQGAVTGRSVGWMTSISNGKSSMTTTELLKLLRTDALTSVSNAAIKFSDRVSFVWNCTITQTETAHNSRSATTSHHIMPMLYELHWLHLTQANDQETAVCMSVCFNYVMLAHTHLASGMA